MSFFKELERLIPISKYQETDSGSYPTIFFNVPETLYSDISHEDFLKHMTGTPPREIPFTMSLIPIFKEDRDRCQKMNGMIEWSTYKPIVSDNCSTHLDIVTDFNTSEDEFSYSDNTNNTNKSAERFSADDVVYVGIYTRAERREKIKRYRSKKRKVSSGFVYECRSKYVKTRPREGGRFISTS